MKSHLFQSSDRASGPPAGVLTDRARNRGSRWLEGDANKSIWGRPTRRERRLNHSGHRDHSTVVVESRDRASAQVLSDPARWNARRWSPRRAASCRRTSDSHWRAHDREDPCLFMQ